MLQTFHYPFPQKSLPPYSSVHPEETPVTPSPATPCSWDAADAIDESTSPIHAGWKPLRRRTYEAMRTAGISPSSLASFRTCADQAWVLQEIETPTKYKLVRDFCHNRWCRVCSSKRAWIIKTNMARIIARREVRLLTLTIRSNGLTLDQCLTKLYRGFRRLRASSIWKERVDGGLFITELKWSERSEVWHPHLHCIIEGRYLPQPAIKSIWLAATGDSSIVDIRPIRDRDGAAEYLTKYLSKTLDPTITDNCNHFAEAVRTLRGKRLCGTFGSWTSERLTQNNPAVKTRKVGHINELILRASNGDAEAKKIVAAWRTMPPTESCVTITIEPSLPNPNSMENGP